MSFNHFEQKIKSPCQNCPSRQQFCQSKCKSYLAYKDELEKQNTLLKSEPYKATAKTRYKKRRSVQFNHYGI